MTVAHIRKAAWGYLTPDVAACADMRLLDLQQFIAGTYHPTEEQLQKLARRMHVEDQ